MSLYQKSVLNKYLINQDKEKVEEAYSNFKAYFHNPVIQQNIRDSKEEQFQEGFLRELFVKVLGYTLNPEPDFNLTTELKNEKGAQKTDGAILKEGKALAVIELKGTDTKDLDKVNTQAFNYKNNHADCVYVVTSNFEKLRFFIHNAVKHIEFNLFTLTKKDFEILWLCLNVDNLLGGIPLKAKEESILAEENITKKLYKDYSAFKTEIWQNIVKNSPEQDQLLLFKKTQKLLDRFLFIFFAEDSGLLPPNSISRMVQRFDLLQEEDAYKPLYEIFKQYFGYINIGRKGKTTQDDIFAYNGGLFFEDEILDNISIDDEILKKHVLNMTNYDFQSEVDVNILGHIFENSLNEIENVTAMLEGKEIDKSKTKRKKDGVFYTPKYITKYIVDNTVGKLCEEKKTELGVIDEEYAKGRRNRKKDTIKKLDATLKKYREWLLNITICDPACGSGAFLNQALEFLIKEHAYIDELYAQLMGAGLVFQDVSNHILEKNIYGVDINDESVEIAKLSLWLRTAQRGRKLTVLSNNIKCGNSLIDDPKVAGKKAFNWQQEFQQVFGKGGFDVVIGNPPYVRQELLGKTNKLFFEKKYANVYNGAADLYVYFYDISTSILKHDGLLGFITPNKWMERNYGKGLRLLLKKYYIQKIINLSKLNVFEDAIADPSIIIYKKRIDASKTNLYYSCPQTERDISYSPVTQFKISDLDEDIWRFTNQITTSILSKFKNADTYLKEYTNGGVYYGIKSGLTKTFIIDTNERNKLVDGDPKSDSILKKMVEGDDFKRWHLNYSGRYMVATFPAKNIDINSYPAVKKYLEQFLPKLNQTGETFINTDGQKEKTRKKNSNKWFETQDVIDYYLELDKPKIIYYHTAINHNFYLDRDGYYISANCYFISNADEYLQCILNSRLFSFIKFYLFPHFGDVENSRGVRLDGNKMNALPVKSISTDLKKNFTSLGELISSNSRKLENLRLSFLSLIQSKYTIQKFSKKLQYWYNIEFGEFNIELEKARKKVAKEKEQEYTKLSLSEEAEWMQYFNEKKQNAQEQKNQINQTDKEIDQIIYELYGLSEEEIKIIENNIK